MATKRVLAVYWNDAASHDDWADRHELAEFCADNNDTVTVGIEVSRDETAIHVAASMNDTQSAGVWKLPLRLIRKVRILGRVEVPE